MIHGKSGSRKSAFITLADKAISESMGKKILSVSGAPAKMIGSLVVECFLIDKYRQTNRLTDRQTDRQTDIHTYRHTDKQTDRQTDRQTGRQIDIHTDIQTNRQTDKQKEDRQADRQTCCETTGKIDTYSMIC